MNKRPVYAANAYFPGKMLPLSDVGICRGRYFFDVIKHKACKKGRKIDVILWIPDCDLKTKPIDMKALKKITALSLAALIIAMGACTSSKHHWHKTTKEEKAAKKGK
jgi:hypothetical protein